MASSANKAVLVLAAWLCAGPAIAGDAEDACRQQVSTIGIMTCLDAVRAQWDKRLNAAYQVALRASESDARRQGLIRAERAWVAYRDANCRWYGVQEGTIRQIDGAACLLDMTKSRTLELEQAMRP